MSFASEDEIDCPCGETFNAELWNSVNLKEDPDLRSLLIGGELNVHPCPMCKTLIYTERFVLIHDPDNELMAFMHPKTREAEREALQQAMERDTAQAQDIPGGIKIPYPPELHFGLESVVEVLQREDESAVQSAILDALAGDHGISVVKLAPAKARAAGLPRSVPLAAGGDAKARLQAGLEKALAANDRLSLYRALLEDLSAGKVPERALALLAQ